MRLRPLASEDAVLCQRQRRFGNAEIVQLLFGEADQTRFRAQQQHPDSDPMHVELRNQILDLQNGGGRLHLGREPLENLGGSKYSNNSSILCTRVES